MLDRLRPRMFPRTLGGDKGFDTFDFVEGLRSRGITPHVAQTVSGRRSNVDGRTTQHDGYRLSQRARKKIEQIWGWMTTIGGLHKTRYRGSERTGFYSYFAAASYNLVRMLKLAPMREV